MSAPTPTVPSTMKALILKSRSEPITLSTNYPVPPTVPGSALVQIISAMVVNYSGDVYSGKRPYPFATPLVPGNSAVGRIVSLGPDSTLLRPGQFVFVDITIRSRDDPRAAMLSGFTSGAGLNSKRLQEDLWRDSTYAQYARLPLESLFPLDEARLLGKPDAGGLGYDAHRLATLMRFTIVYGGLADIGVRAGETVIVAPASGPFGAAAVHTALAMGAVKVIALGRNKDNLNILAATHPAGRIVPLAIANDPAVDGPALDAALGGTPADAYFDISPPMAAESTHFGTAIRALRYGGRISIMAGVRGKDVPLPLGDIMNNGITLRGTWMSTRDQVQQLIRLVETGLLRLDDAAGVVKVVDTFPLEKIGEALIVAEKKAAPGETVLIDPWL